MTTTELGWIDAGKQLPDSDKTVLIHVPRADEPVWVGYYQYGGWSYANGLHVGLSVAHWREIPVPPGEVEKRPGENNWDWCLRAARAIDQTHLIRCLLDYIIGLDDKRIGECELFAHVARAIGRDEGVSSAVVEVYLGEDQE